ncbi:MAG: winged helix-turn-helix domain-containing protein [Candidatus Brocadiia bacterium]
MPARRSLGGGGSGLDAAATVLEEADEPLRCKQIARRAPEAGYWASDGQTPHATIYSAILRDMQKKGDESRFRKVARGQFALAE